MEPRSFNRYLLVFLFTIFIVIPKATLASSSLPLSIIFFNEWSFFGFDLNEDYMITEDERIYLSQYNVLLFGSTQIATGSHTGSPDSVAYPQESPAIDEAWEYFGNTGMHLSLSDTTVLTNDNAGNLTIDFSGWAMIYGGGDNILLGSGAWGGNNEGEAIVACSPPFKCVAGDEYSLFYSATVADDDPSPWAGARYCLELHDSSGNYLPGGLSCGSPNLVAVPLPASVWLLISGLTIIIGIGKSRV